jgi:hypothetical protein
MRPIVCAYLYVSVAVRLLSAGVALPVPITVPSTGFVSLALIDTNNVLVRTLTYAEPVPTGGRTFFWDGTTDLGFPATPGTYTTRAIFFSNAPAANFVMKVGTSGNPPWRLRNGTGDWGGDLGGPSTIAANSSTLMLVWSTVENYTLPGIQQIATNGNVLRSYISFYEWDGRMAGAMDDSQFFLGILNRDTERIEIARYELGTTNKLILTNLPTAAHYTLSGRWKGRWQAELDGMAITTNRIFASMALDDKLFILNREDGAILQQVTIPSPRGLAIQGDRLLVVSSNTVLKLTFDGAVVSELIHGAPLEDPYALTIEPNGTFYVSDGGAQRLDPDAVTGNHRVHVFGTNGTYLRSIGAPGGSPRSGAINRQAFGDIRSICFGPDKKLWVNENITGFQRTSRWNTNGTLEREWFQRTLTHSADLVTPGNSNELIYARGAFNDYPALTAHSVNWSDGTWAPAWSYAEPFADMFQEDVYLSNDHYHPLQDLSPGLRHPVFHYEMSEVISYNGRKYFINSDGNGDGAVLTFSETNRPKPVALVGYHRVDLITNRIVSYYDNGPNQWFTWADTDGNARMALGECTVTTTSSKLALSSRIYMARLEPDLGIRMLRPIGNGITAESILPLKQLLPNGAPVYDWSMLQDVALRQIPSFEGGDGTNHVARVGLVDIPLNVGGAAYTILDPEPAQPLDLPSLDHFWADRNWRKRIAKFDSATGKFLWAAGRRAPARAVNGEMYNVFGLSYSHDSLFAMDVLGMAWLWSKDGLYLGRLLNDAEPDQTWDAYAIHAEVQGAATLFTNALTGKLYMIVNDTGANVYEVTLPKIQAIAPAQVVLSSANAAAARAWDPDLSPPRPITLSATRVGNSVVLSWPSTAGSTPLQSATSITGAWNNVSATKTTNFGSIQTVISPAAARRFYRLGP